MLICFPIIVLLFLLINLDNKEYLQYILQIQSNITLITHLNLLIKIRWNSTIVKLERPLIINLCTWAKCASCKRPFRWSPPSDRCWLCWPAPALSRTLGSAVAPPIHSHVLVSGDLIQGYILRISIISLSSTPLHSSENIFKGNKGPVGRSL